MDLRHTGSVALRARFAGLGIAAFASVALVSALPTIALAEEQGPQDDPLVQEVDPAATEEGAVTEPVADVPSDAEAGESETDGDGGEADGDEADGEDDATDGEETDADATAEEGSTDSAAGDGASDQPEDAANQDGVMPAQGDAGIEGSEEPAADQADDASTETVEADDTTEAVEVVADKKAPAAAKDDDATASDTKKKASSPKKAAPAKTTGESETPEPKNGWITVAKNGKTYYYKDDVRQYGWVKTNIDPITGQKGATRTYWLDAKGVLAKGRVITPLTKRDAAAGKYAYALEDGSIAKGQTVNVDGKIFIADSKGALIGLKGNKKNGFVWRKNVGGTATREHYYLYRVNSGSSVGAYYAVQGYSTDGFDHYTRKQGFVIRGVLQTGTKKGSRIYLATNSGKLASLDAGKKRGWVVSSSWGAKDKRYYLYLDTKTANKGIYYAKLGFSSNGYAHFTTANGYVRTKSWTSKGNRIYIVNKTGRIAKPKGTPASGWLETSSFVKGKHRYYLYKNTDKGLCKGAYYAVRGYNDEGTPHYTYKNGTALTGIQTVGDHIYIAKSTGEMLTLANDASEGVTELVDYGQGNHLYYLYRETSGDYAGAYYARPGYALFKGSKTQGHYTMKKGYLMTGIHRSGKKVFIASRDGVLLTLGSGREKGWCQGDFGQGEQKYYLYKVTSGPTAGAYYAVKGFSSDGGDHYTTKNGYVLREACKKYKGVWYYADDKGSFKKLTKGKIGWQNPSQYYQVSAFNVNNLPASANGFFTYITPSRIAPDASRSTCVETFIKRAMEYLGTEYKWDWAMRPGEGVDCAGLVMQCLYAVGINTPYNTYSHMYDPWQDHNAENMRTDKKFKQVPFSERKRGDLIFYSGHVGIYLGNDQIINAYPPNVQIQSVHSWTVTGCSRVFV